MNSFRLTVLLACLFTYCVSAAAISTEWNPSLSAEQKAEAPPSGPSYRSDSDSGNDITPSECTPTLDTPLARVYQHLLSLRQKHANFVDDGNTRKADELQQQIQSVERPFRHAVSMPCHAEPFIHAVGAYTQKNHNDVVVVNVTDDTGPVILVLTGYSEINWQVKCADEVQIDFIICTGYCDQRVTCVPDGIPVLNFSYYHNSGEYAYAYGADRNQWNDLDVFIHKQTGGLSIRTALGSYYAHETYEVGPRNVEWRIQMLDSLIGQGNTPTEQDR